MNELLDFEYARYNMCDMYGAYRDLDASLVQLCVGWAHLRRKLFEPMLNPPISTTLAYKAVQ
ncbi:IS66 family transposase [Suicoccus acidiformans]|uniref:IS66 family transposase n=1 Tax=Suicoccus acidiformans TaxID=2036206 RepID=UPI000E59ABD0